MSIMRTRSQFDSDYLHKEYINELYSNIFPDRKDQKGVHCQTKQIRLWETLYKGDHVKQFKDFDSSYDENHFMAEELKKLMSLQKNNTKEFIWRLRCLLKIESDSTK